MKNILVNNLEEFSTFAKDFGSKLKGGELISLVGDLGAGKTTFVASMLSWCDSIYVHSPTFTLVNEYECDDFEIAHIDGYRLDGFDSSLEEYIDPKKNQISIIEWAKNADIDEEIFDYIITIEILNLDQRKISIKEN